MTARSRERAGLLQSTVEQAKDRLDEATEQVKERSEEAVAAAEKYVAKHPWRSIAIAGSIGFVVGMLAAKR